MEDFEVFERTKLKASREPTLTITVRGTLNLNRAAFELLGKPEAVELLYARTERVIALRAARQDEPNAYLVRPVGQAGHTRMVVAREFCAWIAADLSAARRYPMQLNEDGLGAGKLDGPVRIVTGNRARRGNASVAQTGE